MYFNENSLICKSFEKALKKLNVSEQHPSFTKRKLWKNDSYIKSPKLNNLALENVTKYMKETLISNNFIFNTNQRIIKY